MDLALRRSTLESTQAVIGSEDLGVGLRLTEELDGLSEGSVDDKTTSTGLR